MAEGVRNLDTNTHSCTLAQKNGLRFTFGFRNLSNQRLSIPKRANPRRASMLRGAQTMRRDSSSGHILLVRQPFPEVRGGHLALKRRSKGGRVEGKPRQKPGGPKKCKRTPSPHKRRTKHPGKHLKVPSCWHGPRA